MVISLVELLQKFTWPRKPQIDSRMKNSIISGGMWVDLQLKDLEVEWEVCKGSSIGAQAHATDKGHAILLTPDLLEPTNRSTNIAIQVLARYLEKDHL